MNLKLTLTLPIMCCSITTHLTPTDYPKKNARTHTQAFETDYEPSKKQKIDNTLELCDLLKSYITDSSIIDINKLSTLLNKIFDINGFDLNGNSPLFYAIQTNNFDVINTILSKNPNPFEVIQSHFTQIISEKPHKWNTQKNTKASDICTDNEIKNKLIDYEKKYPKSNDYLSLCYDLAKNNNVDLFQSTLEQIKPTFKDIIKLRTLLKDLPNPTQFLKIINNHAALNVQASEESIIPTNAVPEEISYSDHFEPDAIENLTNEKKLVSYINWLQQHYHPAQKLIH